MLGDDVDSDIPAGGKMPVPHYYGDIIRGIFVFAGLVMLATLPFSSDIVPFPLPVTISGIVLLGLLAGFMSPWRSTVIAANTLVSLVGTIVFEYQAVTFFRGGEATILFLASQVLAAVFFVALYYSSKTLRWVLMEE